MPSWIILGILSAVAASLVAIFGKLGLSGIDSTLATTVRSIIMAGFLVFIAGVSGKLKDAINFSPQAWLYIALSGIAGAVSWLFYFWALKSGPASGVAALDRLSIIFVIVFACLFLAESLTYKSVLAGILIIAGAVLLVWK